MMRKKKIGVFAVSVALAFTAGVASACSTVELPNGNDEKHSVTYFYNYDGAPNAGIYRTEKVTANTATKKPADPKRTNYTFEQWTTDVEGSVVYVFTQTVTGDLKLYAQWEEVKQPDDKAKITGLEITNNKTKYVVGDELDITVKAVYDNGKKEDLKADEYTVTGYEKNKKGAQTVTVTLKANTEITKTLAVTVEEAPVVESKITGLEITNNKSKYVVGDELDITVKAVYDNGKKEDLKADEYTVTGYEKNKKGAQTVTVTLKANTEITKTLAVTVEEAPVVESKITGLEITNNKTKYVVGDDLDIAVKAVYDNGKKEDLEADEYTVTGYEKTESGEQTVTVTLKANTEITKSFTVNVEEVQVTLEEIKITDEPTKTTYKIYEELNTDGLVVTAYYSDGTTQDVTEDCTITAPDMTTAGEGKEVTVEYDTETVKFTIDVQTVEYKITFVGEGHEIAVAPQNVTKKQTATAPDASKTDIDGYEFLGWFKDGETTAYDFNTPVEAAFKLTAKWKATEYTITYVVDDALATKNANAPAKYTIESNSINLITYKPTVKDNSYSFTGWYTELEDGVYKNRITSIEQGSMGNITLYARIEQKATYKFFFNYNYDGTEPYEDEVIDGECATAITEPKRTGYTFGGWYWEQACTTEYEFNTPITSTTSLADRTVYAKWTPKTITVKFVNEDGETEITTKGVTFGQKITDMPDAPAKKGYNHVGWCKLDDTAWTSDTVLNAEKLTLKAVYTAKSVTIKFNSAEGSAVADKTVTFDEELTADDLPTPTRAGYKFGGWFDSNNKQWKAGVKVTEEALNLTAKWTIKEYTVKYTVKSNVGSAEVTASTVANGKFTVANNYELAAAPTGITAGYEFDGWTLGGSDITEITLATFGAGTEVTLVAKYKLISYTVKYTVANTVNGDEVSATAVADATFTVQSSVTLPTTLSGVTDGYEFKGWTLNGADITSISLTTFGTGKEVTLEAKYEAKSYTVKYVNGTEETTDTAAYKSTITWPTAPTKDGYTFAGWKTGTITYTAADSYVMTASDVTFTAQWTENEYTVNYNLNGGALSEGVTNPTTYTAALGTVTLNNPTKDGYMFMGWYTAAENGTQVTTIDISDFADGNTINLHARWSLIPEGAVAVTNDKPYLVGKFGDCDVTTEYGYATTDAGKDFDGVTDQYKVERDLAVGDLVAIRYGAGASDYNCALQDDAGAQLGVEFEDSTETVDGVEFLKVKKAGTYTFYFKVKVDGDTYRWSYVGYKAPFDVTTYVVVGDMTSWKYSESYVFKADGTVTLNNVASGKGFKVAKRTESGFTWDENYGYGALTVGKNYVNEAEKDDADIVFNAKGTYVVKFTEDYKIEITKQGGDEPDPEPDFDDPVGLDVGVYLVLGSADNTVKLTDDMDHKPYDETEYCIGEFELSADTLVKVWKQTSATAGSYVTINALYTNDIPINEDNPLSAGKYTVKYKVYGNYVRVDFEKGQGGNVTTLPGGTPFTISDNNGNVTTMYLIDADGNDVTDLSKFRIWAYLSDNTNLFVSDWNDRTTLNESNPTNVSIAGGFNIIFTYGTNSSTEAKFLGLVAGKTYLINIKEMSFSEIVVE
ncbi:MAG: InlB B-repeat-containing protein [Clostridiales bacterium]|nr:InlB B-repeat-containing protein [Clostridiales bacterium]